MTTPQRALLRGRVGIRAIVSNVSRRVRIGATLRHRGRRIAMLPGRRSPVLAAGSSRKSSLPIATATRRRISVLARRVEIAVTARSAAAGDTARVRVRPRRAAAG